MQRVLVIGATSAIAEATARIYAAQGAHLALVGRDITRLRSIAHDLTIRGATQADVISLDLVRVDEHETALDACWDAMGGVDVALIAHGSLPDQAACDESTERAMHEFAVNGTSAIAIAGSIARRLSAGAVLAAISSVAGDRGRASNYLYGSAKAALTAYLSGLGQRLHKNGIAVVTVKPGFVDTPMTRAFKKGALWATPDQIARGIVKAIDRKRPTVYLPGFWWWIMQIIRNIPEFVFRRITL